MNYIVPSGLYAIGAPTSRSPVIVTANYKMTYDIVRRALAGCSVWLLVLETYGINVWCAAGKGTFGTQELIRAVTSSELASVVSHRHLILPILGAPGVAAHDVSRRCGFEISYAAVDAEDLPEFLRNGNVTTAAMREPTFSLVDRTVLIPVEIVLEFKSLSALSALALLFGLAAGGASAALAALFAVLGAAVSGLALTPLLLPWRPGRSFAVKGAAAGALWTLVFLVLAGGGGSAWTAASALLILPAISAYYALNFTGCTPYTSRSGVKKEIRLGLPLMGSALALGIFILALDWIL